MDSATILPVPAPACATCGGRGCGTCDPYYPHCNCSRCMTRYQRARLAALKSDRLLREYDAAIFGRPAKLLSSRCAT